MAIRPDSYALAPVLLALRSKKRYKYPAPLPANIYDLPYEIRHLNPVAKASFGLTCTKLYADYFCSTTKSTLPWLTAYIRRGQLWKVLEKIWWVLVYHSDTGKFQTIAVMERLLKRNGKRVVDFERNLKTDTTQLQRMYDNAVVAGFHTPQSYNYWFNTFRGLDIKEAGLGVEKKKPVRNRKRLAAKRMELRRRKITRYGLLSLIFFCLLLFIVLAVFGTSIRPR
ncbi:hypothetical protein B0J14DRAFT_568645 [Halenospora varia]|nr:hypothetical protein B0J14DRAFT_568645 [Halenospora varia]